MSKQALLLSIVVALACGQSPLQAKFRFGNKAASLNFDQTGSYLVVNEKIDGVDGTLKLKDNAPGRIVGSEVVFDGGVLSVDAEADLNFTGTYKPITNDVMELKDGTELEFVTGKVVNKKIKVPSGVTATISGSPILKQPIELEDSTSVLRLAIQSSFDQDLYLNGGKIILDDDFGFTADRKIFGGGIIDVNDKTFKIPGGDFSDGPLEFLNARDVQALYNFSLSFQWSIGTYGSVTDFRGFGIDLTFLNGGKIKVFSNHTLYFANSNFRNVGRSATSGIFDIDSTSTVVFQNCCFVMTGDYTHDSGTMTFRDNCTFVTQGNSFNVTDTGIIRVDGSVLFYDHVGGAQDNPFTFTDQKSQKVLVDGGVIRSTSALRSDLSFYNTSVSSSVDMCLSTQSTVTFVNEVPTSTKNVTLNLNGAQMLFPAAGSDLLNIDPKVNLTLTNSTLSGFNKDVVNYGDANSSLKFGTGTKLRLFDDVTLSGSDKNWVFTGDGSVVGSGTTIKWTGAQNIGVGAADTVNLTDLVLEGIGPSGTDGHFDINATGTLVLQNCTIELDGDYTHSAGTIEFRDGCKVVSHGYNFNVQGLAFVRVDGAALEYEGLSGANSDPFTFTDSDSQKVLVNGGVIRSTVVASGGGGGGDNGILLGISTTPDTLDFDFTLTSTNKVTFENSTPGTPKPMTVDWSGQTVYFPTQGSNLFNIETNVQLTTENIVMCGFNKDAISYGAASSTLKFGSGTKLRLCDYVTLSGADKDWVFTGDGSVLGSGSAITWTGAQNIGVGASSTVTLKGLILEGIGPSGTDGHFDINATGTLVLQNCSVELDGDYTHSAGTIEFRDGCKIVSHGYNFNVQGLAFLRVNGAALEYENLGGQDDSPITFTDKNSQRVFINDGIIRSTRASAAELNFGQTSISTLSDIRITQDYPILFTNATPGSPKAVTLNMNCYSMIFPAMGSNLVNLEPNVNLTIENAMLQGYNKDLVSYGDANASISFGDMAELRFIRNVTLSEADKPWHFVGTNSLISGKNFTLTLDGAGRITLGSSATLILENLKIKPMNVDSIKLLDPGCKIIFDNCDFIIGTNGFEFDTGDVHTCGRFRIFGGSEMDPTAVSTLTFSSTGTWMVTDKALMRLGRNIEFLYKADPANDAGSVHASKRHFLLESGTSVLELDGGILHSTQTGLALDYGKLVVSDASDLIIDGTNGEEAEFGSALDVYIKPSVEFSITGTLAYNLTATP